MRILLVDDIIVPCPTCVRSEEQSRLTHSIKVTLCPENCIPLGTDLDVSLEHSLLELLNWICDECELISIPPDVCRKIVFYIFVLRLRCAATACISLSALLWVKRGVFKINSRFSLFSSATTGINIIRFTLRLLYEGICELSYVIPTPSLAFCEMKSQHDLHFPILLLCPPCTKVGYFWREWKTGWWLFSSRRLEVGTLDFPQ